jgi:hypothetical protein
MASRKDEMDQLYDEWAGHQSTIERLESQAAERQNGITTKEQATLDESRKKARELRAGIAAKLAREFLGDYGAISVSGQWLRRTLIPFWSWMEINAPRYLRLIKNARHEGTGGIARGIGASIAMTAGLGLRMTLLSGMAAAWNAMMRATLDIDDEDDPNDGDMSKVLLIFGKGGDGKAWGIRVNGALADALGWFDGDSAVHHAKDIRDGMREGKATQALLDTASDIGMAPVNRFAQSITPIVKEPVAQATGRDWFPDVRDPRPIGDRLEHLASNFGTGVRDSVRVSQDRAPWYQPFAGSMLDAHDPRSAATYRVRDRVEAWASRNGIPLRPTGGEPTERSSALRNARMALARGENERATRWMHRYFEAGGRLRYLGSSQAGMHPLSSLRVDDRPAFIDALDTKGKSDLNRAEDQWREFWGGDGGFRALAVEAWAVR